MAAEILDDGDTGYSNTSNFVDYPGQGYQNDVHYAASGSGSEKATWAFTGLESGYYRVSATWTAEGGRASNAPYTVKSGSDVLATSSVNQLVSPGDFSDAGRNWKDISTQSVQVTNGSLSVELTNQANGYVIADAIRIERMGEVSGIEIKVLDGATNLTDGSSSINLGTIFADATAPTKTFTVRNLGDAAMTLGTVTSSSSDFTISTALGTTTLNPGASTTFVVTMPTSSIGVKSATISIPSDDADENPFDISLSGLVSYVKFLDDGDSGFSLAGSFTSTTGGYQNDIKYAASGNGSTTATWGFTSLVNGTYRVSASWPQQGNLATNAPFTVSSGGTSFTAPVNQRVAPSDLSESGTNWKDLGSITIANNSLSVQLSNLADGYIFADAVRIELLVNPEIEVKTSSTNVLDGTGSADFGSLLVGASGSSVRKTFTVKNVGGGDTALSLGTLSLPSGFSLASDFSDTSLSVGESTTFAVEIDTSTAGSKSGQVSFSNNDGDENPFNFSVSGTVVNSAILDNGDTGFATTGSFTSASNGYLSDVLYAAAGNGSIYATWTFNSLLSGVYRVSATWNEQGNLASNAPFTIDSPNRTQISTTINQRSAPNDLSASSRNWEDLGNMTVTGGSLVVKLTNNANGFIFADGIRIERTGDVPNTAPVADAQSATTNEDTAKSITLTGSDAEGNSLTYTVVTSPAHGVLTGTAPNLTYTPDANYNGSDSFTFRANDGIANSSVATVSLTISAVNDAPTAKVQSLTTDEDTAKSITLTGSDVEGSSLTYTVVSTPLHGTLTGTVPNLTYTPVANYHGADSFTFKTNDGTADSTTVTITLDVTSVNDAPVANAPSVSATEDTGVEITLGPTDLDGDSLTFTITGPSHGTLTGTAPNLTYTPAANYNGADSFSYHVNDGTANSNEATISFTVSAVNDAPVANAQSLSTAEDTAKSVTLSGSDVEGSTLTFTVVSTPAHGTLSGTAPNLTYTPVANYHGSDSFTYRANDGTLNSAIVNVSLTITSVNDAPVASGQSVTTNEDTDAEITLGASDADSDTLTYTIIGPSHGTLAGTAPNLTYSPGADYYGSDSFTFKVSDGTVESSVVTVGITVQPVNDAPTALEHSEIIVEDTPKEMTLLGVDPDDEQLTFMIETTPAHGQLSALVCISYTAATVTYTPDPNYTGADTFIFRVEDGLVSSDNVTAMLTITAVNDAPTSTAQSLGTNEDTAKSITLSGTDVEGSSLTYTVVSTPAHGTLSGTVPNLTYTPVANYHGSDSFTFKTNDGALDSAVGTISLTVSAVNDAPVANAPSVSATEDTAVAITLGPTDVDGDSLTYTITGPSHGTLTGTAPNLTYTPAANYNGADSFSYHVNDGTVNSNEATISFTVSAVNDAPVADAKSVSTAEDTEKAITLTGSDVEGSSLTFSVVNTPSHGTLTGTEPNLIYTPVEDYYGSDSFTYRANDGTVNGAIVTVSITITAVNDAPTASGQSAATNEDTPAEITLTANDVDGDPLTYTIVGPSHGELSGTAPDLTYIPASNYHGADSFTFKVSDGTLESSVVTVSLTVQLVNDAPVATAQSLSLDEDTTKSITLSGTDVEGSLLSYTFSSPAHGTITGTTPNLIYTPATNYHGSDSFTFKVNDGALDSVAATISLTVNSVNDRPVAQAQSVMVARDAVKPITLVGTDADGDPLTYTLVGDSTTQGVLSGTAPNLIYTPSSTTFVGTDSFQFRVSDGTLNSEVVTVAITITAPPIAADQEVSTNEDVPLSVTLAATDADGDALTYHHGSPVHGTLSGTGANLTYTPHKDYFGTDSFTFYANDGLVNGPIGVVTIAVDAINDAPQLTNIVAQTTKEDTATAPLHFTISDVDTSLGSLSVSATSSNTTLVTNENIVLGGSGANRTVTLTPSANQFGTVTITLSVSDGALTSSQSFVLTVTQESDPPTIGSIADQTIDEDTSLAPVSFTIDDIDTAASSLSVTATSSNVALVPPGKIFLGGSGGERTIAIAPLANQTGTSIITVTVSDGTRTASETFLVTVQGVNDAPTISDLGNQGIFEDTPTGVLGFTIADFETATAQLTVTASSSDTNLIPNGNLELGGSGATARSKFPRRRMPRVAPRSLSR